MESSSYSQVPLSPTTKSVSSFSTTAIPSGPPGVVTGNTPSFGARRGNVKFSSAKFPTNVRTPRKNSSLLSFRSTRRNAARPARTKGVFEALLKGLFEGITTLKEIAGTMRSELPVDKDTIPSTRQNYFMDLEKQVVALERKIRTVEVHKDRIEELRDDYLLKLKLREGAFNLAQALSNRPSKSSKEKLNEARLEQKELSEDLCDIEDELETKLGVFKVYINEFTTLHRSITNGEVIECQIKLATQKWKARCRIGRHHQQFWQDNDIFLLGKVSDELILKIVEVKRIQGNNHVGTMKCQMRDFFSFFPQCVHFVLPTSQLVKLQMDIRWSPLLGDDFLSGLDLKPVYCTVGNQSMPTPIGSRGSVKRRSMKDKNGKRSPTVTSTNSTTSNNEPSSQLHRSHSAGSNVRQEVRVRPRSSPNLDKMRIPTPDVLLVQEGLKKSNEGGSYKPVQDMISSSSPSSSLTKAHHTRSNSVGAQVTQNISSSTNSTTTSTKGQTTRGEDEVSMGSGGSDAGYNAPRTPQNISITSLLESVLCGLEEPREQYQELKLLESQLLRLENALKGFGLSKAPSVTLSESDVLDMFSFLDNDDSRRDSAPMAQITESLDEGDRTTSFSDFISLQSDPTVHESGSEGIGTGSSMHDDEAYNDIHDSKILLETTGVPCIDRMLLQHLLHCEYLLQHLQAQGPLKVKLNNSLKKLYHEGEVFKELLNMAASFDESLVKMEKILPELAAHDHLTRFWKMVSGKDEPLCVSCEVFITTLDEKYGHTLWNDYPDIANKVFSELLSRLLGLEGDDCDPMDSKMSVTIFQYASYFLSIGSSKAIPKALKQIAQDMTITEGIRDSDHDSRKKIASLLPKYPFNHGALFATAHLMSDKDITYNDAAVAYLNNFTGNSPWRSKAIQYYIEAMEHPDQVVRIGACLALGQLQATEAASQLKYLSKTDFSPVKAAAIQALQDLGDLLPPDQAGNSNPTNTQSSKSSHHPTPGLYRTRSMESGLMLDSNETRTKI